MKHLKFKAKHLLICVAYVFCLILTAWIFKIINFPDLIRKGGKKYKDARGSTEQNLMQNKGLNYFTKETDKETLSRKITRSFTTEANVGERNDVNQLPDAILNVNISDRKRKIQEIHDFIFNSLDKIKNEGNCENKKIVRCQVSVVSGFGSLVHRYVICLHIALALNRLFFIDQPELKSFGGLPKFVNLEKGKCNYLKHSLNSISNTCNFVDPECYLDDFSLKINNKYKLLEFTHEANFPTAQYIPGTIPENIEKRLKALNVDKPWHWFTSQLIGYLLQPNSNILEKINTHMGIFNFKKPVIGIYVDKDTSLVTMPKYFDKCEELHREYLHGKEKRLFCASSSNSDATNKIFHDFTKSGYSIYQIPQTMNTTNKRSNLDPLSMEVTLLNILFLAMCDFVVVTYSSNVGRLIWELKTAKFPYQTPREVISMDLQLYYAWYDYTATRDYYLTKRTNGKELQTQEGTKIFAYKKGTLFLHHRPATLTLMNGSKVNVKYVRRRHFYPGDGTPKIDGYVFANDVVVWPGKPKYDVDIS